MFSLNETANDDRNSTCLVFDFEKKSLLFCTPLLINEIDLPFAIGTNLYMFGLKKHLTYVEFLYQINNQMVIKKHLVDISKKQYKKFSIWPLINHPPSYIEWDMMLLFIISNAELDSQIWLRLKNSMPEIEKLKTPNQLNLNKWLEVTNDNNNICINNMMPENLSVCINVCINQIDIDSPVKFF